MNMKIDEVRRIYAPLPNVSVSERTDAAANHGTDAKDSYIPSSGDSERVCSTGNYDAKGEMDDDFSVDLEPENGDAAQTGQYSREYTEQLMRTVTASEASDGRMSHK